MTGLPGYKGGSLEKNRFAALSEVGTTIGGFLAPVGRWVLVDTWDSCRGAGKSIESGVLGESSGVSTNSRMVSNPYRGNEQSCRAVPVMQWERLQESKPQYVGKPRNLRRWDKTHTTLVGTG